MSLLFRLIPDNPVLTKELRVRMRGARAYWILLGYLGFLSLVLMLNYSSWLYDVQRHGGGADASQVSSAIFTWVLITQVFLALFITPAITSGAISLEKEQRTLDLLTMTPLPRRTIIVGKLLSAVLFTALLLTSSLPIVSICFLLGSVDPGMVLASYVMLLAGSFLVGAMGLLWSCVAPSTSAAVLCTYGSLVLPALTGAAAFTVRQYNTSGLTATLFHCVGDTWFGSKFLGLTVPDGTGFVVTCLLAGTLFAAVAMSRLDMQPERRAPLLRGLTLLFLGVQALSFCLWWQNAWYRRGAQVVQTDVPPPIGVLILLTAMLLLIVPVFAASDVATATKSNPRPHSAEGWTRAGLLRGTLASGPAFVLLSALFLLGVYCASFALLGKPGDAFRNVALTAVPAGQLTGDLPLMAGDFAQAALVILVSTAGYSLLCRLLGVLIRNRWGATFLAYLLLAFASIAPDIGRTYSSVDKPGISINLFYLNPAQSLTEMTMSHGGYWWNRPLWLGHTPMWEATTGCWLVIGGLCFALSLLATRRNSVPSAVSADSDTSVSGTPASNAGENRT